MTASPLSESAMLVQLSISQWSARKLDRTISHEVAQNHGTSDDVGKYYKQLLKSPALNTFRKNSDAARTFHYENTLPWNDGGVRILPAAMFFEYNEGMSRFKSDSEGFAEEFYRDYERARNSAKKELNGMFKDADYPPVETVKRKFGFDIAIFPLPEAGDFRVDIDKKYANQIRKEITANVKTFQEKAMLDLWERVYRTVNKVQEKLGKEDSIFRDSLVGNVVELCDILPKMNITGDAKLNKLTQEIKLKLCKNDPDVLRTDPTARSNVANAANDILKKMSAFAPQQ